MEHSPEPWRLGLGHESMQQIYAGPRGMAVATCRGSITPDAPSSHEMIANAERIVACVNACRGIPTEHLTDRECVIICVPRMFAHNIVTHIQRGIDNAQP